MGRPREFDEAEVLDRAMLQFWRHGYDGTSIQDLVDATGVGRQSLYNAFGDKHAVFLAALERYDAKTDELVAPMLRQEAGLQDVQDYVEAAIRLQRSSKCRGCLIVRSALELGADDQDVRAATGRTARRVQKALEHAFERAAARGEVDSRRPPADLAAYTFGSLNGLAALSSTGTGEARIREIVGILFDAVTAGA